KVLSMQEDTEVQEVVEVVNAAKLITEFVTTAVSIPIPAAKPAVAAAITPIRAAKPAAKPKPMKKKDQIEMDAERYHGYKKKPQSESEARKNMIDYLKNTKGFKMAFFKGKTYDQIRLIFQARFDANMRFLLKIKEETEKEEEEIIKSINETPAQKVAKRRRLPTLIGTKVPVVNYEIVMINNKPRYKIIRVDDTHQLYTSFITLLKNFDREDLEDLWKIMKAKFSTSKPTNFSDDYLLVTLKTMFEKTDAQDVIWRSQQTEHGQALLLELMLLRRPKENTKCVSAAGEELTAAKHKLILLELKLFRDAAAAAHMK
nr:hypothetical protein [Tanacetum cinerariifolium]